MRRQLTKLIAIIIIGAVPVFGWATVVHAQSFRSGTNSTVAAGETVDSSVYAAGQTVDIAGTVKGDVYCAGQTITISGHVTGDVLCAGQTVTISGTVDGSVRAAGQNLSLGAVVGRNINLAGQSVVTDARSSVGGDATVGGQSVTLNGAVGRDLLAGGNTITVDANVGRDIHANVSHMNLGNHAEIGGVIAYTSTNELVRQSGARVAGKITHSQPPANAPHRSAATGWWLRLAFYAAALLMVVVLAALTPNVFRRAAERTAGRLWLTALLGLAAILAVPTAIILLFATVIGIPLALLALLAWLIVNMLSGAYAAFLLGHSLLRRQRTGAVLTMLSGASILFASYAIPFVGVLIWMVASCFGTGMIIQQAYRVWHRSRQPGNVAVVSSKGAGRGSE